MPIATSTSFVNWLRDALDLGARPLREGRVLLGEDFFTGNSLLMDAKFKLSVEVPASFC
jgi:hypothetical protein